MGSGTIATNLACSLDSQIYRDLAPALAAAVLVQAAVVRAGEVLARARAAVRRLEEEEAGVDHERDLSLATSRILRP